MERKCLDFWSIFLGKKRYPERRVQFLMFIIQHFRILFHGALITDSLDNIFFEFSNRDFEKKFCCSRPKETNITNVNSYYLRVWEIGFLEATEATM